MLSTVYDSSESSTVSPVSGNLDLAKCSIQAKGPDGKWTRKPLAYRASNNIHLRLNTRSFGIWAIVTSPISDSPESSSMSPLSVMKLVLLEIGPALFQCR